MVDPLSFDGRVAVITGAGGGLGRSHALLLASRGARIVVNDLGNDRSGRGTGSTSTADHVVEEIASLGGTAVASYDSVDTPEGAESIVQTALDSFGRVDILVNNAGFLRDVSLVKMAPDDFRSILRVHLEGTFNVTRAAFPHMRAASYGRIINTSSGSGLYGNFGQSNYSAAKLGIVGFTRSLALEGTSRGITANVIAPLAVSRLTEDLMQAEFFKRFEPEYVSPFVAYLASDRCNLTGMIYQLGGGYYSRVAIVEGAGAVFDTVPTPEQIGDRIGEVSDLSHWSEPAQATESLNTILARMGLGS
jgi:NAD(P)-dependent dehydrogenase (short-subunit alcohol dehydrogenase family)